jgi:hypothetical protein
LLEERTGDAEWRSGAARHGNNFVDCREAHWGMAAEIGRFENADSGLRLPSAACRAEKQPDRICIEGSVRPQICRKGSVHASVP